MKTTNQNILRRLTLAGLFLINSGLAAQTVRLTEPAAGAGAALGEAMSIGELPRPEWQRSFNGASVAMLRFASENAAAHLVSFRSMNLPEGTQLYLYGMDQNGSVVAAHGPYEGHGPVEFPNFQSRVLAGSILAMELRGAPVAEWPFSLGSVERFSAARLEELGLTPQASYQPAILRARKNPDVRTGYYQDELVRYEVRDGIAIREGDMVLGPVAELDGPAASGKGAGARESMMINGPHYQVRWQAGIVAYTLDAKFWPGFDSTQAIHAAIAHWNANFPGILVPRTNQTDYVTFRPKAGVCNSNVGRVGGQQFVNLADDCGTAAIIHEIGHVLGLQHEHNRYDRDQYVKIQWGHIELDMKYNFEIPPAGTYANLGPYDYASIMHYSVKAFTFLDVWDTISILKPVPAGVTVGEMTTLSAGDIAGIRNTYCNAAYWQMPQSFAVDPDAGPGSFVVYAPPYCTYQATEQSAWITLTGGITGTGSRMVSFKVTQNTSIHPRSGWIYVNGRGVSIKQAAMNDF